MIKTNELKGIIAKNGLTQKQVAERIGIAPKTFYEKMKKGVFGSDEIQKMIEILNINNPCEIFLLKSNLKSYFNKKGGQTKCPERRTMISPTF
ncbi:DUF739 domain-containing protein [Thermoclostridium stercorarium]|uniref:helix-turn-helix domain-containing protein n=1 Tax=Thermoclostridium stercorarium TaxID=1510 RepID=UPI0022497A79|nr:helix-turn-helix domain-containing protein [Thermoclostridium stercorarium]UZQ86000.1 DUF739 domain-containing protein [Thermoclostridium stercorarium]